MIAIDYLAEHGVIATVENPRRMFDALLIKINSLLFKHSVPAKAAETMKTMLQSTIVSLLHRTSNIKPSKGASGCASRNAIVNGLSIKVVKLLNEMNEDFKNQPH